MKDVFRNRDSVLVSLYQSILNDAGIPTFIHNANTRQPVVTGFHDVIRPLPQFLTTLSVINDEDYDEAMTILREIKEAPQSDAEWTCEQCKETVPGNFSNCWNCGQAKSE
jgi:predicted aldo/keto reductase-like oxidoreductase